ncbi:hypothetical protein DFH27DRAFT_348186 [Peziza echinospora]|nr:hypothetical protein DFH27DRAFT_348186 [Peziza echinospora]
MLHLDLTGVAALILYLNDATLAEIMATVRQICATGTFLRFTGSPVLTSSPPRGPGWFFSLAVGRSASGRGWPGLRGGTVLVMRTHGVVCGATRSLGVQEAAPLLSPLWSFTAARLSSAVTWRQRWPPPSSHPGRRSPTHQPQSTPAMSAQYLMGARPEMLLLKPTESIHLMECMQPSEQTWPCRRSDLAGWPPEPAELWAGRMRGEETLPVASPVLGPSAESRGCESLPSGCCPGDPSQPRHKGEQAWRPSACARGGHRERTASTAGLAFADVCRLSPVARAWA